MTKKNDGMKREAAPKSEGGASSPAGEEARGAPRGEEPAATKRPERFSVKHKRRAIERLLRGETLDALARELGVTAATIAGWRDTFLAGGEAALKTREPTPQDEENRRLKEALGEMTMRLELAREAVARLQENRPFGSRRSSP
jgi:transposase-like protein